MDHLVENPIYLSDPLRIAFALNPRHELASYTRVCSLWNIICEEPTLWRMMYQRDFALYIPRPVLLSDDILDGPSSIPTDGSVGENALEFADRYDLGIKGSESSDSYESDGDTSFPQLPSEKGGTDNDAFVETEEKEEKENEDKENRGEDQEEKEDKEMEDKEKKGEEDDEKEGNEAADKEVGEGVKRKKKPISEKKKRFFQKFKKKKKRVRGEVEEKIDFDSLSWKEKYRESFRSTCTTQILLRGPAYRWKGGYRRNQDNVGNNKKHVDVVYSTGHAVPETPFPIPAEYSTGIFGEVDISLLGFGEAPLTVDEFRNICAYGFACKGLQSLGSKDEEDDKDEVPEPLLVEAYEKRASNCEIEINGDILTWGYFYNTNTEPIEESDLKHLLGWKMKDGINAFLYTFKYIAQETSNSDDFGIFMAYKQTRKFAKLLKKLKRNEIVGGLHTNPVETTFKMPWTICRNIFVDDTLGKFGTFLDEEKAWHHADDVFESLFAAQASLKKIWIVNKNGFCGSLIYETPLPLELLFDSLAGVWSSRESSSHLVKKISDFFPSHPMNKVAEASPEPPHYRSYSSISDAAVPPVETTADVFARYATQLGHLRLMGITPATHSDAAVARALTRSKGDLNHAVAILF
eukprot:TRINITY_DN2361_c0_g1_i2.p1 TRINITY_DN2361_c0_g1~~TRINITY_DN2361_c0_g1_i2.p1  ORF type:complete len:635 (+),score=163.43 TRINITY_DN2361_c0_g1_i2:83-1987(+)